MSKKSGELKAKIHKMEKRIDEALKEAAKAQMKAHSELAAGVLAGIHASSLTASELKRLAPTKFDKMERRILKLLVGWSIQEIECVLVYRVLPEAKRRATVPK